MTTPPRKHALAFVLVTIFIDAIGFGLIMPVLPRLLMSVGAVDLPHAIEVGAWMGLCMALASFVALPILGNLSDQFGRRPILLAALACLALDQIMLAVVTSLPLIFLGRTLAGAFGGSFGTAQAAVADMTAPEDRAKSFGYVSAAFGIGFVIGPAIGGLLGQFGDRAPFYLSAALSALNLLYGATVFPETLKAENRRPFRWARANPLGAWRAASASPGMTGIMLVLLMWQIASLVYPMTWSFYAIAQFGWSTGMIGFSLAMVGVVIAFSQVFITGPAVKRFGERDAATIGLIAATSGFVAYAFARHDWQAYAIMIAIAFQSLVQPSLMAMMSRRATPQTQGEVQGISAMTMGLGSIIAPLVLTRPMAYFTGSSAPVHFAGAAFAIAAVFGMVALVLLRNLPSTQTPPATTSRP